MAFPREQSLAPQAIGNIVIILKDGIAVGQEPAYQSAHFAVKVVFNDGTVIERQGDLAPHITAQQRNALIQFMTDLRVQAGQQILGV